MTLADALRPNLPALPFALVNPDAVRSIMEACACLPDALASEYGFECRLREGDDDVDLAIAVQHNGGGRAILAGADPHLALPVQVQGHPGWAAIAEFSRVWQDVGSPFYTTVDAIWLELDGAVSGLAALCLRHGSGMIARTSTNVTIDAGIRFLLDTRDDGGWWRDYLLAPGRSDEWVTGYVAVSLARVQGANEPVQAAWNLLASRTRRSGGWAYNGLAPADADSTAWGLLLAQCLGAEDSERAQAGRDCLERHILPDGAVVTYAEDGPIRRFIHADSERSFAGWCGAAACVTAAVAHLPPFRERSAVALRGMQRPDGSWESYWWCTDEYATAFAATALSKTSEADRAAEWVLQGPATAEPFVAALRLQTLLVAGPTAERRQVVETIALQLQEAQLKDGSWEASAALRVPYPEDQHPAERDSWQFGGRIEGSIVLDDARLFTTATVVAALAQWRSRT